MCLMNHSRGQAKYYLENRVKFSSANVMGKNELFEPIQKKLRRIKSDKFWTWKLYDDVDISKQNRKKSKIPICNLVFFMNTNVG